MLRLNRMHFPVTSLGPGRRLGIWLQGCPLACPGCMSRDTWPIDGGAPVPIDDAVAAWSQAVAAGATGLTISGGEPLAQAEPLARLLDAVRAVPAPSQPDVLLYTGYELDELDTAALAVLDRVDAVITGRYRVDEPTRLLWRGSANQVLHPRTELGHARYGEHLERTAQAPPVQIGVDDQRLFVIGIPPPGALPRVERALRAQGVRFGEVAWRP